MDTPDIVYCKDCKYVTFWRKGRTDETLECMKNVFLVPNPHDFCSRGLKRLKCDNCGMSFDTLPTYCPKCGQKLKD